jgi:hydrogenase/urease accessory protein HupE
VLTAVPAVLAHDPGLSSALVSLQPGRCDVVLSFSLVDARSIVESGGQFPAKSTPADVSKQLEGSAADAVELQYDHIRARAIEERCDVEGNNMTVRLRFPHPPSAMISMRSAWLALLPPGHREYAAIQRPDKTILAERLLSANADSLSAVLVGEALVPEPARAQATFSGFLAMGVKHIWTGYDHLMFLFGLLVVTRKFKDAIKIITCFTVAHSITLALATLNLVQISSRVVEPLIAASIVVVGVENFLRSGEPKGRWLLAFGFGTVHGLGFASALREVGVGQAGSEIALPLLSFNLGVELGQVALAAVALPLIWKFRTQPVFARTWIPATSAVVAVLGCWFFVARVWL